MNRSKVQIVLTIDECYRVFWGLCRTFKPSLFTDEIQIARVVVTAVVVVVIVGVVVVVVVDQYICSNRNLANTNYALRMLLGTYLKMLYSEYYLGCV